jgi:predicted transcriptional regulator
LLISSGRRSKLKPSPLCCKTSSRRQYTAEKEADEQGRLTQTVAMARLVNMEVKLTPELQAKVDRAAAENNNDAEGYIRQLVEHYLDHDQWFRQQVKKGLDQLDRGEFVGHEEVAARIEQMFRS